MLMQQTKQHSRLFRALVGTMGALALGLGLPGAVGVASAHHGTGAMCGTTIPGGTTLTLTHSVTGCTGTAFFVGAGATLDLAGFSITAATGNTTNGVKVTGDFATVTSSPAGGIIEGFGAGVEVRNRYFAVVSNLTVRNNNTGASSPIGSPGEGIALWNTIDTTVENNTVSGNGPFAGIGVYGTSSGNVIRDNIVSDNSLRRPVQGSNPQRYNNETSGIRLDITTSGTAVYDNVVTGSGLDGISAFGGSGGHEIRGNTVRGNGFHTEAHRVGDGIRINGTATGPSTGNLVEGNVVGGTASGQANSGHGISSFGTGNVFQNNNASGHGSGPHWDLWEQPQCDNVWSGNSGSRNDQVCIG